MPYRRIAVSPYRRIAVDDHAAVVVNIKVVTGEELTAEHLV
ncbi:MAG: hypothetical protein AAF882_03580 [Pseudomonadota bacterium]